MKYFLLSLAFYCLSFALDVCLKPIENPYTEPYLDFALRKTLEKALLESGHKLACFPSSLELTPYVKLLRETPIAYSPNQRVSAYNLELSVALRTKDAERSFSVVVPYSLPTGALGSLPRRKAIDDALGIIYTDILEYLRKEVSHADKH